MNNRLKIVACIAVFSFLFSCSLVKDPTASNNFKRVKYNSHLKLAQKKNTSKINPVKESSSNKSGVKEYTAVQTLLTAESEKKELQDKKVPEKAVISTEASIKKGGAEPIQIKNLEAEIRKLQSELKEVNELEPGGWWESDPEDWPWKDIVLALIAFLLIVLAVFLLIDLLGALVGSLLGLIILLLLLYFLIDYMG